MTPPSTLLDIDIASFKDNGYVRVNQAFPHQSAKAMQDYMWSQLKELNGIDPHDRSTWSQQCGGLNRSGKHLIYQKIAGERLCGVIDGLLGEGTWEVPPSWGGFLISFPVNTSRGWNLTNQQWHWDGNPKHQRDGMTGLFIFTFFSHVIPSGGGTVIAKGSHKLVVRFFESLEAEERQFKQRVLKKRFFQSHPWFAELTGYSQDKGNRIQRFMHQSTEIDGVSLQVVELTGEPGDAVVCHPSIVHARSPNHADNPRFMRVKGLGRKRRSYPAEEAQV